MHTTVLHSAPAILQGLPLGLATDQVRLAGRHGRRGGAVFQVKQALVGFDRLGAGRDAQLALQRRDAGVIDAQRGGAVAVDRVQAHEVAVGGFMQGVVVQQALRVADGAAIVVALFEQQDQLLQGIEESLASRARSSSSQSS